MDVQLYPMPLHMGIVISSQRASFFCPPADGAEAGLDAGDAPSRSAELHCTSRSTTAIPTKYAMFASRIPMFLFSLALLRFIHCSLGILLRFDADVRRGGRNVHSAPHSRYDWRTICYPRAPRPGPIPRVPESRASETRTGRGLRSTPSIGPGPGERCHLVLTRLSSR